MKNTVGHTGIYAWGDCVRHRFFQKLRSNRRTKNPLPLGMGSVNGRVLDIEDAELEFAGSSVSELQDGLRAVVDRYLELKGEDSDVEITVTLKKSLLRALIECAEEQEVTIDEFVSAALFDYCSANYGE